MKTLYATQIVTDGVAEKPVLYKSEYDAQTAFFVTVESVYNVEGINTMSQAQQVIDYNTNKENKHVHFWSIDL